MNGYTLFANRFRFIRADITMSCVNRTFVPYNNVCPFQNKGTKLTKIHYSVLFMAMAAVFSLSSCAGDKEHSAEGTVADATMNGMSIDTGSDTVFVSTMYSDPDKVPGVLIGDSVAVKYVMKDTDGVTVPMVVSLIVIKHSPYYYIQGTWVEPNPIDSAQVQGVILGGDGTAVSVGMETLLFKEWSMDGGVLLLGYKSIGNGHVFDGTDTLKIDRLDADSLVLSRNGNVVWKFGRGK